MLTPEERRHQQALGQGTAEHLAQLLPRLTGQSYDEFEGLDLNEAGSIILTPDQGWLLYETALRSLPRCFGVADGLAVDEGCQMPEGVCFTCAGEGRALPHDHPLRQHGGENTHD